MTDLSLVLGGARSGKSRYAEALLMRHPPPWLYLATAEPFDAEMAERIAGHRARRDKLWQTREAPRDLPAQLRTATGPVLVDCLTLWLSNLMLASLPLDHATEALLAALDRPAPTVLVANEVGLSIVPDNALARAFRDAAGVLNQRLAQMADRVVFTVAGLPMHLKGLP
jgi:adenosyl cobinamide kinase/adenosyl cobinamide phosphate guanylyltransferase